MGAVSRKSLIAAVARAMNPGCKVDTMLVLEGEQGIGKSQTLQALAEPWVLEDLSDMKSKDCKQEIQGHWFVEASELDAMVSRWRSVVNDVVFSRLRGVKDCWSTIRTSNLTDGICQLRNTSCQSFYSWRAARRLPINITCCKTAIIYSLFAIGMMLA